MIAATPANTLLAFDARAFGRSLIESGALSEVDWRLAEGVARENGHTTIRALLDLGLIGEGALADRLGDFTGAPRWTEPEEETAPLSDAAPRAFMAASSLLLLDPEDEVEGDAPAETDQNGAPRPRAQDAPVRLVCVDPSDRSMWRSLLTQLGRPIDLRIGTQKDVARLLALRDEEASPHAAGEEAEDLDVTEEISHLRDMASEAPVIRFFNQTVERAMDLGASDIHLERFDHRAALRLRVDGMLIDQPAPPGRMLEPLLCRIKIMSGLDIAERRKPQDGRIRMRLRGRMVDLRVSLVPTMYGQDAAIRLQDRQMLGDVDLTDLGFTSEQIDALLHAAGKSHGMLLVTGPTGSGKTTTLYSLLRRLVGVERKVVTVEDPVEYAMDGVNQIQVQPSIGLTFGNTLRHVLRHDPDVILVGEIRDRETAEMAFQSALTGHMVLSTLHTNDAPSTFLRLIDMGVEPYLINAAVEGVTAQRLLRRLCPECDNDPAQREACRRCGGLGYRGRVGVMEFAPTSPAVKRAIRDAGDERDLHAALESDGFRSMRAHAEELIARGVTDEAEVARVLGRRDAPARATA